MAPIELLSDTDLDQLVSGEVPPGRDDLMALSTALSGLRARADAEPAPEIAPSLRIQLAEADAEAGTRGAATRLASVPAAAGMGDQPRWRGAVGASAAALVLVAGLGVGVTQNALPSAVQDAIAASAQLVGIDLPRSHHRHGPPTVTPGGASPAVPGSPGEPATPAAPPAHGRDGRPVTSNRDGSPSNDAPGQADGSPSDDVSGRGRGDTRTGTAPDPGLAPTADGRPGEEPVAPDTPGGDDGGVPDPGDAPSQGPDLGDGGGTPIAPGEGPGHSPGQPRPGGGGGQSGPPAQPQPGGGGQGGPTPVSAPGATPAAGG